MPLKVWFPILNTLINLEIVVKNNCYYFNSCVAINRITTNAFHYKLGFRIPLISQNMKIHFYVNGSNTGNDILLFQGKMARKAL